MAFTLRIGEQAPDFDLPGTDGRNHSIAADAADARVAAIVFSCNHCPYVIGAEDRMISFARRYMPRGVAVMAINSNETEDHPADSFEHMVERAREKGFPFVYLRDETQEIARAFGALRTPHWFVFAKDAEGRWTLRYTGRMDDNPKDAVAARTHELADAVDDLLAGRDVRVPVTNPIGCNVKWKGQHRKWMPPEACDLV